MPGIPNGIVAGWLKHGERGPVLAVGPAPAGRAPGLGSLERYPDLGAGRVAGILCGCPLVRADGVRGRATMIPQTTQAPLLLPSCAALCRTHTGAQRI